MKLKFLLALSIFTLANTVRAAEAAPNNLTAKATKIASSIVSHVKTFAADAPNNIQAGYNKIVTSEVVKNNKLAIAVVATAIITSAVTCYFVRKANKNKKN